MCMYLCVRATVRSAFSLELTRRNLMLVMLMLDIVELTIRRIGRFNLRDESRLSTAPNYFDISFHPAKHSFCMTK